MLYSVAFAIIARPAILWAADRLSPKSNSWVARGLTAAALVALQHSFDSGELTGAFSDIFTKAINAIDAANNAA